MSAIRNENQINGYMIDENYRKNYDKIFKKKKKNGHTKAKKSTRENSGKWRKRK